MNYGIGIDCIEIKRFDDIIKNKKFLEKTFTENEIKFCEKRAKPSQHFAVRFSAKESIIKAFSKFHEILKIKDIEIFNNSRGRPQAFVSNLDSSKFEIELSLSHSDDFAISIALLRKIE